MKKITGKKLKSWRVKMGWTQDFTAYFLDMPYETYRSVETGRRKPPYHLCLSAQIARQYTPTHIIKMHHMYQRALHKRRAKI